MTLPAELFEPSEDRYGVRLALVFGNHAPGGRCPWFESGACHHCDIGDGEGKAFSLADNHARLAAFVNTYADVLGRVAHLVVYNSGSVLSRVEMPRVLLREIVGLASALPRLRVLSLDSREPYMTHRAMRVVLDGLRADQCARPILGLESADDTIRDGLLDKRMPRAAVLRAFSRLGSLADRGVGLDCNLLLAGPGTTPQTALDDALATAAFVFEHGRRHHLSVDLNVHPYYPSRRGLQRFPTHPACPPALAARAVRALDALRAERSPSSGIFVGWHDEGHDQDPDRRRRDLDITVRDAFAAYNRTQDAAALRHVDAGEAPRQRC